jgi:hypothetical protein
MGMKAAPAVSVDQNFGSSAEMRLGIVSEV